jgi:hypothetical protein
MTFIFCKELFINNANTATNKPTAKIILKMLRNCDKQSEQLVAAIRVKPGSQDSHKGPTKSSAQTLLSRQLSCVSH